MANSTPRSRRPPPAVEAVWITQSMLCFELADGRSISVPLEFYPPLLQAPALERDTYELHGASVYWGTLRFRLTSTDLLSGRRKPQPPRKAAMKTRSRRKKPH